ncbi:hypothetical protein EW145_g3303 [Phellinidium pouzarii]|uniref:protein-histidine N-methyltransferase n=1 Tax=Phellinidium pouzarii TaxID=167371 RepID=A0A4S4L813_9AGAM|nr:hypothetical protein EW145_g3303 [Phellinidium pouzarii]
MFKFDFSDIELEVEGNQDSDLASLDTVLSQSDHGKRQDAKYEHGGAAMRELSLEELIKALPSVFSYSPLVVPLSGDATFSQIPVEDSTQKYKRKHRKTVTLLRRDLFDVRYQLISQDDPPLAVVDSENPLKGHEEHSDASRGLTFIDNPSDLVPGVYEGGLKTWECSLDLVDCLASANGEASGPGRSDWVRGKRILEIGCGTAIPSIYLLETFFAQASPKDTTADIPITEIVFQDYNDLVLKLVTFPNVLLAWYASPLAETIRSERISAEVDPEDERFDIAQPGDLHITPKLIFAFRSSLEEQRLTIKFVAGSWHALSEDTALFTRPFDMTLTSETIYQISSLPSLIRLLRRATISDEDYDLQTRTMDLSLKEGDARAGPICLVAAKILYFGVGGGVVDFERVAKEQGGKIATVLHRKAGVGRKVMRVDWTQDSYD